MKSLVSNRRDVSAADLLVAMLVEGDSFAASTLRGCGLSVEEAENESLNGYLASVAKQERRLQALRERIAKQSAAVSKTGARGLLRSGVRASAATDDQWPKLYTLRVTADGGETRFKAAVSCDGRLDLYIETTPFETELAARQIAALFQAIDAQARLEVELLTEINGRQRRVSGFGGWSGAIFQDPNDLPGQRSGGL